MKSWVYTFFLAIGLMVSPLSAHAGTINTQDLVGYWHYKAGVSGTTWRNMAPATMPAYNGTIDRVVLQPDGMYFPGESGEHVLFPSVGLTNTSFTLDSWIRYPAFADLRNMVVVSTPNTGFTTPRIVVSSNKDTVYSLGSSPRIINNTGGSGGYFHIALTYDHATKTERFYFNRTLRLTNSVSTASRWNGDFAFGEHHSFDDNPHLQASFRIYKRALTGSEITTLYNMGPHDPGLLPPGDPLPAITGFHATEQTENAISLSWNQGDWADEYILLRDGVEIARLPASTLNYTDSGLSGGTTYFYSIRPINAFNQPGSPTPLEAQTDGEVTRSWSITPPLPSLSFASVRIDGGTHTRSVTLPPLVMTHTGANTNGWSVHVEATPFQQINGTGSRELPPGSLRLKRPSSLQQTSGTSPLPSLPASGEVALDGSPVELIRAEPSTGEGTFEAVFPSNALELTLDTSRDDLLESGTPTTYQSTLTWTMSVGP